MGNDPHRSTATGLLLGGLRPRSSVRNGGAKRTSATYVLRNVLWTSTRQTGLSCRLARAAQKESASRSGTNLVISFCLRIFRRAGALPARMATSRATARPRRAGTRGSRPRPIVSPRIFSCHHAKSALVWPQLSLTLARFSGPPISSSTSQSEQRCREIPSQAIMGSLRHKIRRWKSVTPALGWANGHAMVLLRAGLAE